MYPSSYLAPIFANRRACISLLGEMRWDYRGRVVGAAVSAESDKTMTKGNDAGGHANIRVETGQNGAGPWRLRSATADQ